MAATTEALKQLTPEQVRQFHEQGYLKGFPLFTAAETDAMVRKFDDLARRLPEGTGINYVNWWHKQNRFLYDVCMTPRLLDFVEDLLGPDFFLWGSQFFSKDAGDQRIVPWHQDAQYWPLAPQHAVTVFIAFTDCLPENAGMQVIPGTHRGGILRHHTAEGAGYVLNQELDEGEFDPAQAVYLDLRAGEISLHHDGIVHGSGPNHSAQRRIGFTMRFSSTDVKCDLAVWPTFQAFLARGTDRYGHNPAGTPPTGDGIVTQMRP
ncbi:MAG: phytanoyl-CoA dioxygenase family protein [Armatimonadetes bacterium]|jgi:ectoine hydroxylase-related dioxygenase (phytanoyl-CoA dioxygenase family)|nr:phytanoyl-CoA dioxygenase family protein [Armatimonadota bacterium]